MSIPLSLTNNTVANTEYLMRYQSYTMDGIVYVYSHFMTVTSTIWPDLFKTVHMTNTEYLMKYLLCLLDT